MFTHAIASPSSGISFKSRPYLIANSIFFEYECPNAESLGPTPNIHFLPFEMGFAKDSANKRQSGIFIFYALA
jgi:hypothetical protein